MGSDIVFGGESFRLGFLLVFFLEFLRELCILSFSIFILMWSYFRGKFS